MTTRLLKSLALAAFLCSALAACLPRASRLGQDQILKISWETLRPNTSSQNRGNWEMADVSRVYGREMVRQFSGLIISNCPGPSQPENSAIRSSSEYWYVRAVPRDRLAPSGKTADSLTPDKISPEPNFLEANFLIDPFNGQVIARKYVCIEE